MSGEPGRRLSPRARWVWRLWQALGWGALVVAGVVVGPRLDGALSVLALVVPPAGLVAGTAVIPELSWRRWRWDVRADAVEIRHGMFTVRRTTVPMLRVQHVDTTRGLVEQALDLATVVVHTAAGSHEIPLLEISAAEDLRDRIAQLAGTADA